MPFYEYKVVPAPERTPKVRGLKGPARFAHALETLMNEMAQDGWQYLRAERLPEEERRGFMGRAEVTRNVLVFRRELFYEEDTSEDASPVRQQSQDRQVTSEGRETTAPAEASAPQDLSEDAPSPHDEDGALPRFSRRPLVADKKEGGTGS